MCRGDNSRVWVDEKQGQDLSMPWLTRILQLEGEDLVLKNVWKRYQAAIFAKNAANILHGPLPVFQSKDLVEKVPVLTVIKPRPIWRVIIEFILGKALAKSEAALCNIVGVVIV